MSEQSPSDDTSTIKFGIGQPVRRFEDSRLVTGRGRYQDDVTLPRQAHAVFLRSPHAHARILSIDTQAAAAAPGVLAVYTGKDYAADGLGMPKAMMPRKKADGSPMFAPQRPALVIDRVRYVGDPIAMVIAETLMQAKDAAELIAVGLRAPAIGDRPRPRRQARTRRAYGTRTPTISPTPVQHGNKAATDAAFARAAHVVRRRYVITRVHAQYMEPRGAIGAYDAFENRYTLYADVNYPHRVRNMLATSVFKVPESSCAGGVPRRGRRVRRKGLAVCRAPFDAVGGAKAWPAGQVDAANAPKSSSPTSMAATISATSSWRWMRRKVPGCQAAHAGQSRRLCRLRPAAPDAVWPDRHADQRLRHSCRPCGHRCRAVEYQSDRSISGRGAARGQLSDRAHHRGRRARVRDRSDRATAAELIQSAALPYRAPLGPVL